MPIFVKMAESSNINFKMLCRFCLSREGEMFSIYGRDPSRLTNSIREKILFTTSIKFPPSGSTSAMICTNCDILLNGFFIFRKRSLANSLKAQAWEHQQSSTHNTKAENGKLETPKMVIYHTKSPDAGAAMTHTWIKSEPVMSNQSVTVYPKPNKPILINAENGKSILEAVKKATNGSLERPIDLASSEEGRASRNCRQGSRIKTPSRKASEQCLEISDDSTTDDEDSSEEVDILKYLKLEMTPNNYAERKQCKSPNDWGVMMIRRCAECGAKFTALSELRKHKADLGHSDPTCEICKRTFFSPIARDNHMKKKHKSLTQLQGGNNSGKKQRRCPQCEEWFPSLYELRQHKQALGHLTPQCNLCQRKFMSKDACERHLRKKHKVNRRGNVQSCSICGMSFAKKKDLKIHINVHLGIKEPEVEGAKVLEKYLCSICGKGFSTQRSVQQHKNSAHSLPKAAKADEYVCPICSKVFHYKKRLEDHVSLHIGFKAAKTAVDVAKPAADVAKVVPVEVEVIETTPSSSAIKKVTRKKKTWYRYEADADFVA